MRNDLCIIGDCTMIDALKIIDAGGAGVAFALDTTGYLLGILTDGDIRKAILKGAGLTTLISSVINRQYTYGTVGQSRDNYIAILKKIRRRHLPIIDENGVLVDVYILDEMSFERNDTPIALMAGGLGSRLGDLTVNCPKPMLKVGNKPILEHIINGFVRQGFYRFILCVNYKAEIIKEYFNDGRNWGIEISYTEEKKRLGTAGALYFLKEIVDSHLIVMNGDVLTSIDYIKLMEYHIQQNSVATVAIREYELGLSYGVIEHNNYIVSEIKEKPIHRFHINAGIYVLDNICLSYIPSD